MARESALTRGGRVAFGGLLESVKATAGGGTKNARGDFTPAELRGVALETSGVVIDRSMGRGAAVLELEREVLRLQSAPVEAVRLSPGGALELCFERAALELPPTGWLLRTGGEEVARAADEPAWALARLRALTGRTVTRAGFRRRDDALALELDDDPYAPGHELLVRGCDRRRARPWALTTADGVRIGPRARHPNGGV